MNYWLHPEAREDLREAAEYYRQRAGIILSQSLLAEFERSVDLSYAIRASELLAVRQAPFCHGALPVWTDLQGHRRPASHLGRSHTIVGAPATGEAERSRPESSRGYSATRTALTSSIPG